MLRSTLSSGRIATRLLGQASQYNFCWGMGLLDPRKHTTMNHNPNNMYIDLWDYGQYPDWWHNHSIAPRTYEPQVANILLNTLNQRYVTPMPCRDSTSPTRTSKPKPIGSGKSGSPKTSKSANSSTNFTRPSSATSPKESSSKSVATHGSSNSAPALKPP